MVARILDELGVKYTREFRFEDCRDKGTLPFDFFIEEHNKIIEFDGQGHFEPIYGEERFVLTKRHDKIKNKYCEDNNIGLLRIPFWESENAKSMIINFLKLYSYPLIIKYNKSPYE